MPAKKKHFSDKTRHDTMTEGLCTHSITLAPTKCTQSGKERHGSKEASKEFINARLRYSNGSGSLLLSLKKRSMCAPVSGTFLFFLLQAFFYFLDVAFSVTRGTSDEKRNLPLYLSLHPMSSLPQPLWWGRHVFFS